MKQEGKRETSQEERGRETGRYKVDTDNYSDMTQRMSVTGAEAAAVVEAAAGVGAAECEVESQENGT